MSESSISHCWNQLDLRKNSVIIDQIGSNDWRTTGGRKLKKVEKPVSTEEVAYVSRCSYIENWSYPR